MSHYEDAEREARSQLAEFDQAWQRARQPYIDRLIYILERNPRPKYIALQDAINAGLWPIAQ